jgi:hypothetical protein
MHRARRFDELLELLQADTIWPYKRWAVMALMEQGKTEEALAYAESCRNPRGSHRAIDVTCEEILLNAGRADEAYARYGLRANDGGPYLATFRSIAKRYPHKPAAEILADLVETTPGEEGKWFAAAKEAGLYDEALALASRSPCDPKTLTRAARDYAAKQPAFAVSAGLLALHWLVQGHGYEITSTDVWDAYRFTVAAAEQHGSSVEIAERIRKLVASEATKDRFVSKVLARELGALTSS